MAHRRRQKCRHEDAEFKGFSGGYYFSAGDVWDDIREEWYCPECGRFLTEREVAKMLERRQRAAPAIAAEEVPF